MSSQRPDRTAVRNRLLGVLPAEDYERLRPHLQPAQLSLGEVIYESGAGLGYIYFPTTSVVSLLYTMENGSTAEMGMAGNDGVVGIALFLGGGDHAQPGSRAYRGRFAEDEGGSVAR